MSDAELHAALRDVIGIGRRGGYDNDEIAEQIARVFRDAIASAVNKVSEAAAFVEVVQGGYMKGCARVEGRCPACGARALALGAGCRVTCASPSCPDPSAVDDYLDPRCTCPDPEMAARSGHVRDCPSA